MAKNFYDLYFEEFGMVYTVDRLRSHCLGVACPVGKREEYHHKWALEAKIEAEHEEKTKYWHENETGVSLQEFLEMTNEEFIRFVKAGE